MAPSHALASREGAAKRWQGHAQAGLLSREIREFGVPTPLRRPEGNTAVSVTRELAGDPARSENLGMCGTFMRENREIPRFARCPDQVAGRPGKTEVERLG